MASKLIPSEALRGKSASAVIAKLLTERQQILVLLSRLGELKAAGVSELATVQARLQQFCQLLVDYLALGHFEVYPALEEQADDSERGRGVKRLAKALYPCLAVTTKAALAFNDRYDCQDHCEIHPDFWEELSQLGEIFATRIELEDRLCQAVEAPLPALHELVAAQPLRSQPYLSRLRHTQ